MQIMACMFSKHQTTSKLPTTYLTGLIKSIRNISSNLHQKTILSGIKHPLSTEVRIKLLRQKLDVWKLITKPSVTEMSLNIFFILAVLSQKSFQVNLLVNRFAEVLVTQETLFRSGIVILFLTHKFIHKNQED